MDPLITISLVISLLALFVSGLTFWLRYKDYHLKLDQDRRDMERDQPRLDVFLYHESNRTEVRLVVSNRGYRPVNVEKVTINFVDLSKREDVIESVPQKKSFKEREYKKLPCSLNVHEKMEIILSKEVARMALNQAEYGLDIRVYDLERNVFRASRIERFDTRNNELSISEIES